MKHVLIVEDDPEQAIVMRRWALAEGYACTVAPTGALGARLVTERRFDVLVIDIELPDLSGLHVLQHAKIAFPDRPAIVATAHQSSNTSLEALDRGADHLLLKPVGRFEFVESLDCAATQ